MKLIDLLVKELPERGGWPANISYIAQDEGSATWGFLHKPEMDSDNEWMDCSDAGYEIQIGYIGDADDCNTSVISKQQYEAALDASKAVVGHNGWIQWAGGECPVDSDAIVEVRFSSGELGSGVARADSYIWRHEIDDANIVAYRLHDHGINSLANDDRLEQDLNECIGQDVVTEWDGDGLPPAGCECEARYRNANAEWAFFRCVVVDCGVAFGWSGKEAVTLGIDSYEFRPLRTEAERERDKLAASLHIAAGASPIELNGIGPLYFKLADAIISGSVFGTTFKAGK